MTTSNIADNLTVFIPTINRTQILRRLLEYYQAFNTPFRLVIADSSSQENKEINKETVESFGHSLLAIEYLPYETTLHPYLKWADMVQKAQTKYIVLNADDDFLIPAGIEQCIQYLERHEDFVCCQGNYLGFTYTKDHGLQWKTLYLYAAADIERKQFENPSPSDRLSHHLIQYYEMLYAVHRTELFQLVLKEMVDNDINPTAFGLYFIDLLQLVYGKSMQINTLYAVRRFESRVAYWPDYFECSRNQGSPTSTTGSWPPSHGI